MEGKTPEEMAQEINNKIEAIKVEVSNAVTKEQLTNLETKIEALKVNEVSETNKTAIEELQEAVNVLKDNSASRANVFKSFEQQVAEQLEAKKDSLKSLKGNANAGDVVLTIKAAGTQTTGNITLPIATPASYSYQNDLALIPSPDFIPFVQNWTDNGTTDRVSLAYVDEITQEGDAAFIGEGVVKPLIDIDYEIRYSQAKKVAGKIKVSEEALDDIPFMQAEINRKLRQRHDLALQDGILNGDGTGANLTGITEVASVFVAGGLAASVDNAQNYDVIVAAYNQILVTSDSNYIPNAVFVHPTDATLMKLTKDTDGNYILPPFTSESGDVINNVRVVQNTKIPVGFFLMGDFTKAHVRTYKDYTVRVGYTGDDFEKNLVTILGESRVHLWISENEEIAFVYDEFSVAKTALETV
jgi:HK97 family phage major capsid protein